MNRGPRRNDATAVRPLARIAWGLCNLVVGFSPAGAAIHPTGPPTVTVPVEISGSTVFMPVRVNGSSPLWFILDSGANSCVLDHVRAREVGLREIGTGNGSGAGSGPVPYRRYRNVRFDVGGARFRSEHLISLDLSNQPAILGRPVDGILGSDLFQRFVVEIDYEAKVVRLHEPATFRYTSDGEVLPLSFERRLPYVVAILSVPGQPPEQRRLLVDTGSQDAVDDSLLLRSSGQMREVTGGVGMGQTYSVKLGKFAQVRLGRLALENVPGVAPGVCLVGTEVLRRFRMIFDYRRAQLILEPNRHLREAFPD